MRSSSPSSCSVNITQHMPCLSSQNPDYIPAYFCLTSCDFISVNSFSIIFYTFLITLGTKMENVHNSHFFDLSAWLQIYNLCIKCVVPFNRCSAWWVYGRDDHMSFCDFDTDWYSLVRCKATKLLWLACGEKNTVYYLLKHSTYSLGHLSHSGWPIAMGWRPSSCVVRCALTSSPQKLLGQS